MKPVRALFALMLCLSLMASFGQFTGVSAQDAATPIPASALLPDCVDSGKNPEMGLRELGEGESATVTPPITASDDCNTLKFFTRFLILQPGEAMYYEMPLGRAAFQVLEGSVQVDVESGFGWYYHGDCQNDQPESCERSDFTSAASFSLDSGDTLYINAEADQDLGKPLIFTLTDTTQANSGGGNRMMQGSVDAKVGGIGSGTVTAALSRGWCDTSAC